MLGPFFMSFSVGARRTLPDIRAVYLVDEAASYRALHGSINIWGDDCEAKNYEKNKKRKKHQR